MWLDAGKRRRDGRSASITPCTATHLFSGPNRRSTSGGGRAGGRPSRAGAAAGRRWWAGLQRVWLGVGSGYLGLVGCLGDGPSDPAPLDSRAAYFVSASGTPGGDGSRDRPWDLQTALSQPETVRPGDTIWVAGGTYSGEFVSRLTGLPDRPVVVRAVPGERARLVRPRETFSGEDPAHLRVEGGHVWFWGLELEGTGAGRSGNAIGINMAAAGIRLINNYLHGHTGNGVGAWSDAPDSEVYGNVIVRTGLDSRRSNNPYAHGIYCQNETGSKRIEDNLVLAVPGTPIHCFSRDNSLYNIQLIGNVAEGGQFQILVGGGIRQEGIVIARNVAWGRMPLRVGFGGESSNDGSIVEDNYLVGNRSFMPHGVRGLVFRRNVLVDPDATVVGLLQQTGAFDWVEWRDNTWYGGVAPQRPFQFLEPSLNVTLTWPDFQRRFPDMTATDRFVGGTPTTTETLVRPNRYEEGRANVVVLNWGHQTSVDVDLSGVLRGDDAYEVRDAFDFGGPAVASGTGSRVTVPLGPSPFGVFVVLRRGSGA